MKDSLGKHRFIHWLNFIHFIKLESSGIKNKIISNSKQNILFCTNSNKFCLDKYVGNNELNNTIDNIIIDEELESNKTFNNSWLINSKNSCRYDVFITLYRFCI